MRKLRSSLVFVGWDFKIKLLEVNIPLDELYLIRKECHLPMIV